MELDSPELYRSLAKHFSALCRRKIRRIYAKHIGIGVYLQKQRMPLPYDIIRHYIKIFV